MRRPSQPNTGLRFDLAEHLLDLAARAYPGTTGGCLLEICPFDTLKKQEPKWLRRTIEAIDVVAAEGADPARWERDALALLAGDPVDVPSWLIARHVEEISPAPITWWAVDADGSLTQVEKRHAV